jgi:hypothetical protein
VVQGPGSLIAACHLRVARGPASPDEVSGVLPDRRNTVLIVDFARGEWLRPLMWCSMFPLMGVAS